jgi:hypothetical protein
MIRRNIGSVEPFEPEWLTNGSQTAAPSLAVRETLKWPTTPENRFPVMQ